MSTVWLVVGFLGQALFSMRFLVQWISSERAGESRVPLAFWYLSLAGGATLLSYAIHRKDPVFIVGQLTGLFVYGRNLQLIHRKGPREAKAGE
ncbi:MAG: lipid-A-disaccharide synthase N-terminal domain-containing protein [Acidobacteria bacterium]|nr:lipid-A-disaccharide synthase N-terminal domain-containing protein [Acidobacteriota bacterium]